MTNEEKQIEEMSQIITKACETKKIISSYKIAETIYAKGYRKASDVAREVIDNILSKIRTMIREIEKVERNGNSYFSEFNGSAKTTLEIVFKDLAELKKKYESEDTE